MDRDVGTHTRDVLSVSRSRQAPWVVVSTAGKLLPACAAMIEEGLALLRELGNKQGVGNKLSDLGILKHDAGDEAGATRDYAESLRLLWEGGDTWYIATPVAGLAAIAMSAGNAEQASRLIGAATALRARSGGALWPNEQTRFEQTVTAARTALGNEGYTRAVATGQALPLADVIAEAAAVAGTQPGAGSSASRPLPSAN